MYFCREVPYNATLLVMIVLLFFKFDRLDSVEWVTFFCLKAFEFTCMKLTCMKENLKLGDHTILCIFCISYRYIIFSIQVLMKYNISADLSEYQCVSVQSSK